LDNDKCLQVTQLQFTDGTLINDNLEKSAGAILVT